MIEAEVSIERSPQTVWAYFTEPSNWAKWWGGGMKAAQWAEGGQLEWSNGDLSSIETVSPGKEVHLGGTFMATSWVFKQANTGDTLVRISQTTRGGAQFSDGGASQQARLRSCLTKLKEHIESETAQDSRADDQTEEYACPYCDSQLEGPALITVRVGMASGVVDFQTTCPACGRTLSRKDFENATQPADRTSSPPGKKWWQVWK